MEVKYTHGRKKIVTLFPVTLFPTTSFYQLRQIIEKV